MNKTGQHVLLILSVVLALLTHVEAQTVSPVQSNDRPFGLDIVNPVNLAGSDALSQDFQENALPGFQEFIDQNLAERVVMENASQFALDPAQLVLSTDYSVRTYFVSEGAGYHNTLGFSTSNDGVSNNDEQLIFPDASSGNNLTENTPLQTGDFVDLGEMEAGTALDFFLIANGANGGTNVWTNDTNQNADGFQHVVAYAEPGSPYLLIGFEDLYGGGDEDYNDLLFVVDIGTSNVQALIGSPEPATWAVLGSASLVLLRTVRRRRRK